ncbi:MAG: hypothetical protein AAF692_13600, partial [Pseudomonadota bacterium]
RLMMMRSGFSSRAVSATYTLWASLGGAVFRANRKSRHINRRSIFVTRGLAWRWWWGQLTGGINGLVGLGLAIAFGLVA